MTHTIVLAGGESFRIFQSAGFDLPKSLIKVNGKEILLRAIESYTFDFRKLTVVVSAVEEKAFDITGLLKKNYPAARLVCIPEGTKGALVSGIFGAGELDRAEPVVLVSGDSEVEGGISSFVGEWKAAGADAATLVFESNNPRYSYVVQDADGDVTQIVEKKVVGNLATTGVFYFDSVATYLQAASWCLVNNSRHQGLFYNSSALNFLVEQGKKVMVTEVSTEMYIPWGLPRDLLENSRMR